MTNAIGNLPSLDVLSTSMAQQPPLARRVHAFESGAPSDFRHKDTRWAAKLPPLAKNQILDDHFPKTAIWIRDKEVASKYSERLSPHAVIGKAVWLRGVRPAVILDVKGHHCLVRISDEKGGWSELKWIKGYDGPIIGTPPSDEAVAWRRQIMTLPLSARPPLPRRERASKQS